MDFYVEHFVTFHDNLVKNMLEFQSTNILNWNEQMAPLTSLTDFGFY